jgi:BirA family biotin operon repressor/biotin-[acetyl-CoA-carboxylase] ligase
MSTPVPTSFPRSGALLAAAGASLDVRPSTGSTNADLLAVAVDSTPFSAVVTLDQTAGRGRLDRAWTAPAGQTLAASVLVRADLAERERGWLPLVAGAAVRDAVVAVLTGTAGPDRASRPTDGTAETADTADAADTVDTADAADTVDTADAADRVTVKWPNDVLVDGRKVSGILCQVAADGSVVVGAGVNLTIPAELLPTPTATSLRVAGAAGSAEALADAVLAHTWAALREAVVALATGGAVAQAARDHVRAVCGTVGRPVRVELPDGDVLDGDALGVDDDGRITIRDRDGRTRGVAVGDVTHLRHA